MLDRFDYDSFFELVERLARTHRPLRFVDCADATPEGPFFVLRHDVDYSTGAALRLAELEHGRGIRATYGLLLNDLYYNLLSAAQAGVPRRLVELGHEVALHYDVGFLRAFPRERWHELLEAQAELLGRLAGEPVRTIAMHQPGLNGDDPFRGATRFLNAYDDRFFRDMPYLSDSCRAWRDAAWALLESGRLPPRFQLVLHPINWGEHDRERTRIFTEVHDELRARITAAQTSLLAAVARHPAVREHEQRLERRRGGAEA